MIDKKESSSVNQSIILMFLLRINEEKKSCSERKPILSLHGRDLRKSSYSKGDDKIERITVVMMILIVVPIQQQVLVLL